MPPDGTTAFISYSREDSEFVLRMARDLKAAGANVWLDQLDIQPGQRWARALQDAITNAPRFLVILSPASVKSTNVEDEVSFALEERKTIIPVMYSDCNVPFQLRSFQYADFRHDYDHGLRILLQTMGVVSAAGVTQEIQSKVSSGDEQARAAERTALAEKVAEASERALREEQARQAAEQERLEDARRASEQEKSKEKHRREAEQARRNEEAKQVAEQARVDEAKQVAKREAAEKKRKEAVAQARREDETKKAAEQAAAERKRKQAEKQALLEREREEEKRIVNNAVSETLQEMEEAKGLRARVGKFAMGGGILIVAGIAYWMLFRGSNPPPPQPAPVSHAKVIDIKPLARGDGAPAGNGQVNGGQVNGGVATGAGGPTPGVIGSITGGANGNPNGGINSKNNGIANGAGAIAGGTGRAALLGEHRLSLQWISWEKFGTATVVNNDGVLVLKGSQHVGDEYLTVEGTVTSIEPRKFTMHGVIVTKIDSINKGQPCKRNGDMTFAIMDGRKFWRLQQMDNPCAAATDYVDIYLR